MENEAVAVKNENPFGITLADAEEYGKRLESKGNLLRMQNAPVRDVEKQSFWDFVLEPDPEEDKFFNEEVMEALRGYLI